MWAASAGSSPGDLRPGPVDYGCVCRRSVASRFAFEAAGISLSRETILCAASNDKKTSSMTSHCLPSSQDHLCPFSPNAVPHACLLGSQALYAVLGSGRERRGEMGTLSRPREDREHFCSLSLSFSQATLSSTIDVKSHQGIPCFPPNQY